MLKITNLSAGGKAAFLKKLADRERGIPSAVRETVAAIVADVRARGDAAVLDYTAKFDCVNLRAESLVVTPAEIDAACNALPQETIAALERAAENITAFHRRQVHQSWLDMQPGSALGQKVTPLDRAAVYVPGGRGAYPSSVLMNAIPARVAGVGELVMATPPMADGSVFASTLAAAKIAGVERIYKVGGAQAIAALAFGTATVARADKIVGPGNIYVAAAKREVFGYCGIDSIAGPSEVCVIADSSANPRFVAADLLAQAEHDPMASAILVTDSAALAQAVAAEVDRQLAGLSRREIAGQSIDDYGAALVVGSIAEAVELANELSPEHLELLVAEPLQWLGAIRNAGAIFLGPWCPEPLGDYLAGPNHVLPTGGTARFFSPLSVDDFVKKSSVLYYSQDALRAACADIVTLANSESLTAHAAAAAIRFEEGI